MSTWEQTVFFLLSRPRRDADARRGRCAGLRVFPPSLRGNRKGARRWFLGRPARGNGPANTHGGTDSAGCIRGRAQARAGAQAQAQALFQAKARAQAQAWPSLGVQQALQPR